MDLELVFSNGLANTYLPQTNQMDQIIDYNRNHQNLPKKLEANVIQAEKDENVLHSTTRGNRKELHEREQVSENRKCFRGHRSNGKHYMRLLKDCTNKRDLRTGEKVHAEISKSGLLETDVVLATALINMYAKCGKVGISQEVFDKLPFRDVVSWTALIAGYAQNGYAKEALDYFEKMRVEGILPNSLTFVCSLNACACIGDAGKGEEIHADILKHESLNKNMFISNALIDMYAKCGLLEKAAEIFEKLPMRNIVTWTALISGYAKHGYGNAALICLEKMQEEGFSPNAITYVCSLKACASIGALDKGKEIHMNIEKDGLVQQNIVVGNALIDMYAKCGSLTKAAEVFHVMPVRNIVTWSTIVAGYAQHGFGEEALHYLEQMKLEGITPDAVTYISSLKACASTGAIFNGQQIHAEIITKRLLGTNLAVGNTLIDMYAKCGSLRKAHEVFERLPIRNVVTWNAIIAGYAQIGMVNTVFLTFDKMIGENIIPNQVTFLSVLTACSHAGLVARGQMFFEIMSQNFGISSSLAHQTCMIDLLGRAGQLDKAMETIEKMRFHGDLVMWLTLLGACKKWSNLQIGEEAFGNALQLDAIGSAAYVCMYNMYSHIDVLEDV